MNQPDKLFDEFYSDLIFYFEKRKYILLIKSGDHIFDNFILEKIKSEFLHGVNYQHISSVIQHTSQNIKWLDIIPGVEGFEENLKHLGKNQVNSNETKSIYILPDRLLNDLLENQKENHVLPYCLFLSDKFHTLRKSILAEILISEKISFEREHLISLIEGSDKIKEYSISKIYFYGFTNFNESSSSNYISLQAPLLSFDHILDKKGVDFIKSLSKIISLDVIESFFRSFIYIRKDYFFFLSLTISDIISLTNLPINEVEILLIHATDEEFQILAVSDNRYSFKIPEYLIEWRDLAGWIEQEKRAYQQYERLESLAIDYFGNVGTLLSKEQIDQVLIWEQEAEGFYVWEKKYRHDKALTSNYILLSQNNLDEQLKSQQRKRSRIIKNSIRVSIAVSIAFLLSSFTALIAYLERNSAIKQQELALVAKEEAEESRTIAEIERQQALEAQENERLALGKAEIERLLALESKAQAEIQRSNAINALDMAKASEKQASLAREVAEKNEKIAKEATINAEINFEKSEKLRNQQEARATALEALGHFDNKNIEKGFELAKEAFEKNYKNDGFPLQSEIFKALLYGQILDKSDELNILLEFPGKHVSLSPQGNEIAVYTIDGQISILEKDSFGFTFKKHIMTEGYVKAMGYFGDSSLIYLNLQGQIFTVNTKNPKTRKTSEEIYTSLLKISGKTNFWIATKAQGSTDIFNPTGNIFTIVGQSSQNPNQAFAVGDREYIWAVDDMLYRSQSPQEQWVYVSSTNSSIKSMAWSYVHDCLVLGLENGQIQTLKLSGEELRNEEFSIHASRVSHLEVIPYAYGTELMISTGYDGSINLFILDQSNPMAGSISSRINLTGHRSWIREFIMDKKNGRAYSIGNDRMLKIWPLAIEELLR